MSKPKPIRKAIVLAAGFGSRLDPLTRTVPKPLLPFHGKTMLEQTFDRLAEFGVTEVLVNLHTHADRLFEACRSYHHPDLTIQCSFEPELLGTGGALRRAAWFFDGSSMWVVNSDVIADLDPQHLLKAFHAGNPLAVLWMIPDQGPRTVQMAGERIVNFRGPAPGSCDHVTFSGVQLVREELLRFIPKQEEFSTIVGAYQKGMKKGLSVKGVSVPKSRWADVGTPEQYLEALSDWADTPSWVDVHPSVSAHPNSSIRASVVMSDVVLGASAEIQNAIVGPGVNINRRVERLVVRLSSLNQPQEKAALHTLGYSDGAAVECLSPRGSERSFFRVFQGRDSVMLIRYNPARKENEAYALQAKTLHRANVPVFKVHAHDATHCFSIIEDLGRVSLYDRLQTCSAKTKKQLYRDAIDLMDAFHQATTTLARKKKLTVMPAFTRSVYEYEHNLFLDHYLADQKISAKVRQGVERDLKRLMNQMLKQERVVVHRDYQSTNLMLVKGHLRLIDFQGMRFGVAMYDLASLLQDPYVAMSPEDIEEGLDYYLSLKGLDSSAKEIFWLASAQRLIQAIGAYDRLSKLPGCEHFQAHIEEGRKRLADSLNKMLSRLPALASTVDLNI